MGDRSWRGAVATALRVSAFVASVLLMRAAVAAEPDLPSDIPHDPAHAFGQSADRYDFIRREVMIPMRDGVKLHTILLLPKGAQNAPILLTRTPYGAAKGASRTESTHLSAILPGGDDVVSVSGYIRVIQDVRGKYGSEGSYVLNRPLRGPLNSSSTDQSTDTWDTLEWLTHNVPESNQRVGIIGTSYSGWLVLMALVDPHPALKVAVAIAPMVDTWRGDDWFHNGAFREIYAFDYIWTQTATQSSDQDFQRGQYDDFDTFLEAGSAGELARRTGAAKLPAWQRISAHPAYDSYWQEQAVDRILAKRSLSVPTMYVDGLWDQEDIYGAVAAYAATEPKDTANDRNFLVIGPWNHGGSNRDSNSLGPLHFESDTGYWFRRQILQPFLDQYLKDGPKAQTPPVLAFETGTNTWRQYDRWPQSCPSGCEHASKPVYLAPGGELSFTPPAKQEFDEYVSDPAKPVPYRERPVRPVYWPDSTWGRWLVDDQRNFSGRPDVLSYVSPMLTTPIRIAGQPVVHLQASTTGTDADWIVKLIDVYPGEFARQADLGGYQLMVSADILRGRYRESFEKPKAIAAGQTLEYQLVLPTANHVFLPGHRIMVQIQSSWFPLYDRNPQTYVPNIFFARPGDFRKATQRIYTGGAAASRIDLPILPP